MLFKLVYKGDRQIKAFGILVLPADKEENFNNTQLVQVIVADKMTQVDLSKIVDISGKRVFAVTVDLDNNVSRLTELK